VPLFALANAGIHIDGALLHDAIRSPLTIGIVCGAVLGKPLTDWKGLDLTALRGVATINGEVVGEGVGGAAMGHPLEAVAWVANHLAAHGRALVFRDVVITGSMITSKAVKAGDVVRFSVERLGEAELRVD